MALILYPLQQSQRQECPRPAQGSLLERDRQEDLAVSLADPNLLHCGGIPEDFNARCPGTSATVCNSEKPSGYRGHFVKFYAEGGTGFMKV